MSQTLKIDARSEDEVELELDCLHRGPNPKQIQDFIKLWAAGFDIRVVHGETTRKDAYGAKVKTGKRTLTIRSRRGKILVTWTSKAKKSIVKFNTCGGKGSGYTVYDEGPGIKNSALDDVEKFLADVPDTDPRAVFDGSREVAHDFANPIVEGLSWTTNHSAIVRAKVRGIYRLYQGVFLSDIKSPAHDTLWFLIDADIRGQIESGAGGPLIGYERKSRRWCAIHDNDSKTFTDISMRQVRKPKFDLSTIDQVLIEYVVDKYSKRIKQGQ